MAKVSVIVPIYGVERFIERCAKSLFEQTLEDMEFIFVDDCTPDKSIEILRNVLKQYPHRERQTKIVHHEINKGLPQARRTGIERASGQYIAHCDSDDWVELTMYEEMYNKAIMSKADLVICDLRRTDLGSFNKIDCCCHSTQKKLFITNCLFQHDHWSLCNKIFKREVYNNSIVYPKGSLGEDMALSLQLINNCYRIDYIKKPFYNYYLNTSSITKKKTASNYVKNFFALKENTDLLITCIMHKFDLDEPTKKAVYKYLRMINSFCLIEIKHLSKYKHLWKQERVWMPISFFFNKKISTYNKIIYCLSQFSFYPLKSNRVKD